MAYMLLGHVLVGGPLLRAVQLYWLLLDKSVLNRRPATTLVSGYFLFLFFFVSGYDCISSVLVPK